ncbi:hypothetical protein FQN55_006403 [Onygenales sp. PD_40]|nr:hypothetical protein FQN55_006403 [Onygenales sp. PD_40]
MSSTSQNQQQPPDFSHNHTNQPSTTTPTPSSANTNTHNLAVAATTAANYAADNHLAGLVEAATAAAGQDVGVGVGWPQSDEDGMMSASHGRALQSHLDSYAAAAGGGVSVHLDDGFGDGGVHFGIPDGSAGGRQMRHSNAQGAMGMAGRGSGGSQQGMATRKRKRAGTDSNVDPAITGAAGHYGGNDGQDENGDVGITDGDGSGLDIRELPPQQALSNARAAGVHSAAALFRQPSATSKKYTRPPMSKMYSSLELSPENFLHLQAAAKAYMLDDAHPERRDCVGQRGKGDTEMVKLRLWNCVRDFLDGEGNGDRFFAEGVANDGIIRHYLWPRDEQKIISLVMPLLRRMVTNERQRTYAIEKRKGGGAGSAAGGEDEQKRRQSTVTGDDRDRNIPSEPVHAFATHPHPPQSDIDLNLMDLLMEGYPTDWDSIARSYDTYNTEYRLDNLGSISGLQQPQWWGLVAAVDSHYQIMHHGDVTTCDESCESREINRIVSSEGIAGAGWRVGGGGHGQAMGGEELAARNYFATGITKDVTHILRENLLAQHQHQEPHSQPPQSCPLQQQQQQQPFPSPPPATTTTTTAPVSKHPPATSTTTPQIPPHQITVHINTINPSNPSKRLIPRLDISADQIPNLPCLLHKVRVHHDQFRERHAQQQLMGNGGGDGLGSMGFDAIADPALPVKVWLEDGLVEVRTQAEWAVALLTVSTVDWMDGELRVVVGG